MKFKIYVLSLALCLGFSACEKYLEVGNPKNELPSALAFSDDKTATASVSGIYVRMNQLNYQFANVLSMILPAMSADEFVYAAAFATYDEFKNNAVLPSNSYVNTLWSQPYQYISQANMCIEGLEKATNLSPQVKAQLLGEAKFIRAFNYFYLVNFFGDVPLLLTSDITLNNVRQRDPQADVYAAMIKDLQEAKASLFDGYPSGVKTNVATAERIRPNKAAASALLARAYLYTKRWTEAESEASEVIKNQSYKLVSANELEKTFQKNSTESIWQLQPVNIGGGRNTWEGFLIVPATATAAPLFRLIPNYLYNAFEAGDKRDEKWVGKFVASPTVTHKFPSKYKVRTATGALQEYTMVLRLGEQYLIRAEANYNLKKFDLAEGDINIIRNRANLGSLSLANNEAEVRKALEQERRVELFGEWGHRWFDLRRWPSVTGAAGKTRADDVLPALKPGWKSTAIYLPLPQSALLANPNLTQND